MNTPQNRTGIVASINKWCMQRSVTVRIALNVLLVCAIAYAASLSMDLMNTASTPNFVIGIILLILSIGVPIELVIVKIKNKINKNK